MNETIIRNHNQRVDKDDVFIHNGDFAFKNTVGGKPGEGGLIKPVEWESRLNGKIIFIRGNHDRNNSTKSIISDMTVWFAKQPFFIVHNPEHANLKYKINLVGHVHQLWKFKSVRYKSDVVDLINVGCDVWNFMPISFDEILTEYQRWKKKYPYGQFNI